MTSISADLAKAILPKPRELVKLVQSKIGEGQDVAGLLTAGIEFTDEEAYNLTGLKASDFNVELVGFSIKDVKESITAALKSDEGVRNTYLAAHAMGEKLGGDVEAAKISMQTLADPDTLGKVLQLDPEESEVKNIAEAIRLSIQGVSPQTQDNLVTLSQALFQAQADGVEDDYTEKARGYFDGQVGVAISDNLNIIAPSQAISYAEVLLSGCDSTGDVCERLNPILSKIQGDKTYAEKATAMLEQVKQLKTDGKIPEYVTEETVAGFEKYLGEVAASGPVKDFCLEKGKAVKVFIPAPFQCVEQASVDEVNGKDQGKDVKLSIGDDGHIYGTLLTDEDKEVKFKIPYEERGEKVSQEFEIPKSGSMLENVYNFLSKPVAGVVSGIVGVVGAIFGSKSENKMGWLLALLGGAGTIPAIIQAFKGEKTAEASS